ncbi:hypothetical protein BHM03_00023474 [Ensete ventricosum]|nr:hypothetical protein BHM03_00023474 [Ensete ventricosum]
MSFYSGCCRLYVPDNLTAFMAYHVVVPFHHVCCPCGETCVCRWGVPTLPVSGRLYDHWRPPYIRSVACVGSATSAGQLSEGVMTWRPGRHLSYHSSPPPEDLLEAADEGAEDEVLCLAAGSRSS